MKRLSECTVMVVDDAEVNLDILTRALEGHCQVCVALDGETALESIAVTPPDLILLDVVMSGMDGYEVCKRLKASAATRHIPVLFLTALADAHDEAKGLALGAADYIAKPFNLELIKARVRNHLELKLHRDHLEELVQEKTRELALTREVTIDGLASLAEYRDPETGGHI